MTTPEWVTSYETRQRELRGRLRIDDHPVDLADLQARFMELAAAADLIPLPMELQCAAGHRMLSGQIDLLSTGEPVFVFSADEAFADRVLIGNGNMSGDRGERMWGMANHKLRCPRCPHYSPTVYSDYLTALALDAALKFRSVAAIIV